MLVTSGMLVLILNGKKAGNKNCSKNRKRTTAGKLNVFVSQQIRVVRTLN